MNCECCGQPLNGTCDAFVYSMVTVAGGRVVFCKEHVATFLTFAGDVEPLQGEDAKIHDER